MAFTIQEVKQEIEEALRDYPQDYKKMDYARTKLEFDFKSIFDIF